MKNFFKEIMFLFLFSVGLPSAYSQQAFIPLKEGALLEYEITDSKGNLAGYSVNRIESIVECGDDCVMVTYSSASLDRKRQDKGEKSMMTVKVVNGDIYSDPSMFKLYGGNTIEGGVSVLPAVLYVGDRLNDYTWNTRIGILTAAVSTAEQQVVAVEELAVPAGAFLCSRVEGISEINTLGLKITNSTVTWYAPGIGPVRSDVYDSKGKLRQSRLLVKYSE